MSQQSYLIVGAGVFGASTALHLSRQDPRPTITLLDRAPFPDPVAASHDINKIVRSDYGDLFYCKLGLEALEHWRNDPLFRKLYHQSGLLKVTDRDADLDHKIIDNYRKLGVDVKAEMFGPEELRRRFDGLYSSTDLTDVKDVLWNPSSGWAEADKALQGTIEAAIENGVRYLVGTASKLILENGSCSGVVTEDGKILTASNIILSTGASTANLLLDSAPTTPALQAGSRLSAAAVCEAYIDLTPSQTPKFEAAPAFVLDANTTQGETMPPTPNGQLKFIRDISLKNTVTHPASGLEISVPLTNVPERSQWTSPEMIPGVLREDIEAVIRGIYGENGKDLIPCRYRLCWDAMTPDNNWFICPHPRCKNLYIATGGSWHGWKFLPITGAYVVKMLKGELSEEMRGRWEWDRSFEGVPPNPMTPVRELRDLEEE